MSRKEHGADDKEKRAKSAAKTEEVEIKNVDWSKVAAALHQAKADGNIREKKQTPEQREADIKARLAYAKGRGLLGKKKKLPKHKPSGAAKRRTSTRGRKP